MADWDWVTISALATATGTLILAAATFASVRSANRAARVARGRTPFMVELLYSDHEGGQRATGLFMLAPGEDHHWICSVVQHWNLDRPNPR